ncbi:kinase-like domain-containing protein [Aspergillus oleicola]
MLDPEKFQKHLARHLRQLSLDVLPIDELTACVNSGHSDESASSNETRDSDGKEDIPSGTALQSFRDKLKINVLPFSTEEGRPGFVPIFIIQELVHEKVQDILREENIVDTAQLSSIGETVRKHAPQLFTLLVDIGKESEIVQFLEENITDQCLPAKYGTQGGLELLTKQNKLIQTMKSWDEQTITSFEIKQYQIWSPIFKKGQHYDFDEKPPITEDYTEVFRAHIHQHHYEFGYATRRGKALAVVVKGRPQPASVNREMRILRELSSSVHSNLVDLLFTYEKGGIHYLVVPYADMNLREYWTMRPNPELSGVLLKWALDQMAGIADALALFHEFPSSMLGVTRYGRHGDIKAENILWFRDSNLLKIAGFQLANLKGREEKDSIDPRSVIAPPTYSPPDKSMALISRKWDIWSLGCLYLELITFLVLGSADAIVEFSNKRLDTSGQYPELRTDDFYTYNWQNVKPSVVSWVDRLKRSSRCTNALRDVLTLIMTKMIVIEPEERASAAQVHEKLKENFDRAASSSYYLLDSSPVPEGRPARGNTSSFLSISSTQSGRERRRGSFARAIKNLLR